MKNEKQPRFLSLPGIGDLALSGVRPLIGISLGLLAGAVLIAISGVNPFTAYVAMLQGALGSPQAIANVLVRASPLLLGGVGVALGIKAGLWNVGIEGYMYAGAIGATWVGIAALPVSPLVHITLAILAAGVVAVIWGVAPAYLRAYRGVNEVISTIMMNYVAIFLVSYLVHEPQPMAEPGSFFPMSLQLAPTARLPILLRGSSLHPGFIIGLAACILFYLILRFTPFGFRTRMLGVNPVGSRYAGVNVKRQILFVLLIGALAGGVAGAVEVMGLKGRLYMDFVAGVGYESVAVALLAAGNPLGVIASALFFAALKAGGATMSIQTGVGGPMTIIIEALCVIFVIGVGYSERKRLTRADKAVKGDEEVKHNVA
ncbi:MAG: ABC transporter permease [Anaerolineaceae bacterium]|nr:ABC transporter permease [Anaerolineaceae bacterium]